MKRYKLKNDSELCIWIPLLRAVCVCVCECFLLVLVCGNLFCIIVDVKRPSSMIKVGWRKDVSLA